MPVLNLYNMTGEKIGTVEAKDEIFGIEPHKAVLHEVLVAELAAARSGTASTKTRGMVRGGGRKPFKQKGTGGRARQGSIRAPHMPGGGVAHGPKPRSYAKKVNKKVRVLALKSALSAKVQEENIIVVDNFDFTTPKTQDVVKFLNVMDTKKQLFILADLATDKDFNTYLSARNIKDTIILQSDEISVFWLLKQDKIIITKEALSSLEEVLA